jgi:pimeloyl-ACP methyl ester carboxylesterase
VEVLAPGLPSPSSTSDGLADDAEAVRRAIRSCHGLVVAVGWSYGGDAISMAAGGEPSVCRLVYVSAVPRSRTHERFDLSWIENDPHVQFLADASYVLDSDLWLNGGRREGLSARRPGAFAQASAACGIAGSGRHKLRRSWESIPTTVIIGSADELISDDDRARASELRGCLDLADGPLCHLPPSRGCQRCNRARPRGDSLRRPNKRLLYCAPRS